MSDNLRLRAIFPAWVKPLMRADLAREQPGDDRLAVSDQQLAAWFAARGINTSFHLDGDGFGAQGDGPLLNFPDDVIWYLFAEGSWLFLDGGELDLGLVRDSTLNARNDAQVFAETFEAAAFIGDAGSFEVTSTVCATGETSGIGAVDCTVGS
jgi:hypothetical protein